MQETATTPTLGSPAPRFDLPATDGRSYSLDSFSIRPCLAVVFLANHCPYVGSWEDRLTDIARQYDESGVAFVAISSNDIARFPADSPEKMRERAEACGYPFPYLYDEDQSVARQFGATRTPEVFVFDRDRLLRYHGAIDSDYEEGPDLQPYVRDALDALLEGQDVALPQTPPVGCTMKWKA